MKLAPINLTLSNRALSFLLIIALLITVPALHYDAFGTTDVAQRGSEVFEQNKAAVITIRSVISFSFDGTEQEDEMLVNATLIQPDGLAVLSLALLDPTTLWQKMGEMPDIPQPEIVRLSMILADTTEIPAELILRDNDLDLAFVRPKVLPDHDVPCVDIKKLSSPSLLEEVVSIQQLGEIVRRAHSVFIDRIEAIIERPRKHYFLGSHRHESLISSPVFNLDGDFIGIGAIRATKGTQDSDFSDNVMVLVLSADDIVEVMEQVPER